MIHGFLQMRGIVVEDVETATHEIARFLNPAPTAQ